MLADLETPIKRIGNFIGGPASTVVNDEESLKKIVFNSSFSEMKKDQVCFCN